MFSIYKKIILKKNIYLLHTGSFANEKATAYWNEEERWK